MAQEPNPAQHGRGGLRDLISQRENPQGVGRAQAEGLAPNRKSGGSFNLERRVQEEGLGVNPHPGGRGKGKSTGKLPEAERSPAGPAPALSPARELRPPSPGHAPASSGVKPAPGSCITLLPHASKADLMPACSFPGLIPPPAPRIPAGPCLGMAQRGWELMEEAGGGAGLAPCLPRFPPWITKSPGVLPQNRGHGGFATPGSAVCVCSAPNYNAQRAEYGSAGAAIKHLHGFH